MDRVSVADLAARLIGSSDSWGAVLPAIAGAVGLDAALVVATGPPVQRLGAFGLLPAEAGSATDAIELELRLRRAGFVGIWILAVKGGMVAGGRRGRDLDAEERAWLDSVAPILELGLRVSAEGTARQRETDQRRGLEERLELLERQSIVGSVAASVAHDLAAPVSALLMEGSEIRKRVLELSTMFPDAGPTLRNCIEDLRGLGDHVLEAAERARFLLTDFRLAARGGSDASSSNQSVSVGDALRACVRLVRPLASARVTLDLTVDSGLPAIPGARRRLEQAFTNLLVNAIHAAQVREGRAGLVKCSVVREAGEIVVEIVDNGAGVPPELRERIFEPFFTTKPAEQGTGLGLPITREIVHAHGGTIEVDSARGRGATFRIRLPVAVARPVARKRATVMVVHADAEAAATLRRLLTDFEVTVAESADRAVEILTRGATFDAIIADLASADCDGPILFARLRRRWPGLERKIVFAGAGSHTSASAAFLSTVPNRRFQTPISPEELRPIIEAVVAAA